MDTRCGDYFMYSDVSGDCICCSANGTGIGISSNSSWDLFAVEGCLNCTIWNDPNMAFNMSLLEEDMSATKIYDTTAERVRHPIYCDDSTRCVIRCENLLSCAFTTIYVDSHETIIECDGEFACLNAVVIPERRLFMHKMKILCLGM